MSIAHGKILVHLKDHRRLVLDLHEIYYLEAQRDETTTLLQAYRRS